MRGSTVVDIRTSGLHPALGARIVEVAVVHVSERGVVTGSWDTLINPGREFTLHPVHGISVAEIADAPSFENVAGRLMELLTGRVFMGHNHLFTARFLDAEFGRCGYEVPMSGLCTMGMGWHYIGPTRSLAACCHSVGIEMGEEHRASADAQATAALLAALQRADPEAAHWDLARTQTDAKRWPEIAHRGAPWRPRTTPGGPAEHFLARLVRRLPDPALSEHASHYLATFDRALLDRHLSVSEATALTAIADELRLGRIEASTLHALYLRDLAVAAWADGVITENERTDLHTVGHLLGYDPADVDNELVESCPAESAIPIPMQSQGFALAPGALVVFTGKLSCPHADLEDLARSAGLSPHQAVTRKVALVVAADPDNLSAEAQKARDYGIPVVTENGFRRMIPTSHPPTEQGTAN